MGIRGENAGRYDDLNTANNYRRQAMDALLENKPIKAWLAIQKVQEYIEKVQASFVEERKDDKQA